MSFEIIETVNEQEIPDSASKYYTLFRAAATLAPGESLKVKVDKRSQIQYIRRAFVRYFEHSNYSVVGRKMKSGHYCFITPEK